MPVCVIEDHYQVILGHTILWEGGDRDCIVPLVERVKQDFPSLDTLSLDKGFESPAVDDALSSTLELVALPQKGRSPAVERTREQAPDVTAARQQHPAIESAINMLEYHGLQRIRSFGADGFAHMVGISIIAAHLVRVGRLLRDKEKARLERQHRRRTRPAHSQQTDSRSPSPQAPGHPFVARPANVSDWASHLRSIGPKKFRLSRKKSDAHAWNLRKKGGFLTDTI